MVLLAQFPMRKVLILKQQSEDVEDSATPCMQDLHTKCFTFCLTHCTWLMMGSSQKSRVKRLYKIIYVYPCLHHDPESLLFLTLWRRFNSLISLTSMQVLHSLPHPPHCSWLMMGSPQNYCTTPSPLQTKLNSGSIQPLLCW